MADTEAGPESSPAGDAATFSAAEWLALLPAAAPRGRPQPWERRRASPDPPRAAAARRADPLTETRLLALLAPSPALRRWVAVQLALQRATGRFWTAHWIASVLFRVAVFMAIPLAADVVARGIFSQRHLVTALVAQTFVSLAYVVANVRSGLLQQRLAEELNRDGGDEGKGEDGSEMSSGASSDEDAVLDRTDYALVARWLQACSSEAPGMLVAHCSSDPFCPCARQLCLGHVPGRAFTVWAMQGFLTAAVIALAFSFFEAYTQYVTLAWFTWTHTWSAVLAALCLFATSTFALISGFSHPWSKSFPVLTLEGRLQRRAVSIALGTLVSDFQGAAAEPDGALAAAVSSDAPRFKSDSSLDSVVYRALTPVLSSRFAAFRLGRTTRFVWIVLDLITMLIYLVGSSCIPAYILTWLLYNVLYLLWDLSLVAVANSDAAAIGAAYLSARNELRRLLVVVPPRHEALRAALQDRERALDAVLAETAAFGAAFAGVRVTPGVVRTVGATLCTVAIGVYGLMRGSGVSVELGSICSG